jgi:hypothetical protein
MREIGTTAELVPEACARTIYNVVFRLTSISELYGPDRAVEWAQSLLDDPELLAAFAQPPTATRITKAQAPPASARAAA